MFELVIESAEILRPTTSAGTQSWKKELLNIGISGGKIQTFSTGPLSGAKTLSFKGLTVLPGLIDSQVHMREPGMTHKEDLEAGTRGAALGGITAVFEMPNTVPATTTQEALEDKFKRAQGRTWVDHAFFVGGSPDNVEKLAALERLPGTPGIKIFMGSSTGTLLVDDDPTLEKIFRAGSRRVTLHSEDEAILRANKKIAIDSGDVKMHPVWRSVESALSSTKRLLALARKTGRQVHVLHVTSAEEMELLGDSKDVASVEVLPQHLTLFAPDCYERLGTLAQQNPPIREKRHLEGLWKGIQNGTVDVLGSDHAPHTLQEKNQRYPNTPSGMPGVQTTVPVMLNHVNQGRLSLERFVELMTTGPRRVFGVKNKGLMKIGADADFTVVDLKAERTIENKWIASRSAWTPFDGMKVRGWPVATIVRGHVVMQDDQLLGTPLGEKVLFDV
jgi:dihydroorotase